MATEVIHIIDPNMGSGYDYDSLVDWEAGEQGDLTGARDEIAVAKCRCTGGTADSVTADLLSINGWTTSSTQYIKIWTDPAESYRHNGTWQTGNKYRLVFTGDEVYLSVTENFVQIIGLQLYFDTVGGWAIIDYSGTGGFFLDKCIIQGPSDGSVYIPSTNTSAYSKITNCIFYDLISSAIYARSSNSAGRVIIYNNTVYNCQTGIRGRGSNNIVKNNLVIGCTDCYYEQEEFEVADYNAYDEGTDPGTHGINLAAYTDAQIFVDAAADNFHLVAGSPAINVGANLYADSYYAFQDDIDGNDRGGSGASWDVGADEYIALGAALPRRALDGPFYGSLRGSVR